MREIPHVRSDRVSIVGMNYPCGCGLYLRGRPSSNRQMEGQLWSISACAAALIMAIQGEHDLAGVAGLNVPVTSATNRRTPCEVQDPMA